jgi:DNA-binding CsgD family transcriptional regulator
MTGSAMGAHVQDHVLDSGWAAVEAVQADQLEKLLVHANIDVCLARFVPVLLAQLVPPEHLHGLEIIGINEADDLARSTPLAVDDRLLPWVIHHVWGQAGDIADLVEGRSIVRRSDQALSAFVCVPLFARERLTAILACSVSAENDAHLARIIQGMTRIGHLSSTEHTVHCASPDCPTHGTPSSSELTSRQRQILEGMEQHLTNRQIATRIGFSESTVRMESMAIYRHFGVHSRSEAVTAAARTRAVEQAPEGEAPHSFDAS